jgi:hypothetical protein
VYVEKCHVDRDDNAVVLVNKERTIRVPAAMVASLLLGPGTRVTYAAIALLANSGTVRADKSPDHKGSSPPARGSSGTPSDRVPDR